MSTQYWEEELETMSREKLQELQLQHIIYNPERMITVQQTGPQINFPANGPTGSFVATL